MTENSAGHFTFEPTKKRAALNLKAGLSAFKFLVRKKIEKGEHLSAVESHILRNLKKLKRNAFGPSELKVFLTIVVHVFPITFFVTVLSVVSYAVYESFSFEAQIETQNSEELVAFEAEELVSVDEESPLFYSAYDQGKSIEDGERDGAISFISGMIAVYLPSEANGPQIARDIVEVSLQNEIDPFFVAAVISVESNFRLQARSHMGAVGLMQLLPSTAKEVWQKHTGRKHYPILTDSKQNIELGVAYLKELENAFRGNRFKALCSYNWGINNVLEAKKNGRAVPGSVVKYSNTIIERALRWRKQFDSSKKLVNELKKNVVTASANIEDLS